MKLILALLGLELGAGLAVLFLPAAGKGRKGGVLTALISLAVFLAALSLFPSVARSPLRLAYFSSHGVSFTLRIDTFSLGMVALVSLLGSCAGLFSLDYMRGHDCLNRYYGLLLLFLGTMNGVLISGDLFTLFLFWEIMTLSAFFLVMFDNQTESIRAAIKYFLMGEAGALCMLLSILGLFSRTGTLEISAHPTWQSPVLLLGFLLGAGVKAGIVPLHTWLPDAHPAAPSPISSLLSGVMIKMGVYLLVRIFWQMFPAEILWQFLLCGLGSLTILVGVMMALVQHDAKRLLAYHSVSQVGYMILGLGTGVAVGVAGGIFHLVNHALFKGLLFLCIGAVIYRTGTRDLGRLGGLARSMPLTFATFLVAALAISGVPPLNGFMSKWMIYQGVIEMGKGTGWAARLWELWLVCALFGSTLTLASFVKLLHTVFLGSGKGGERETPEVGWSMKLPMTLLAAVCLLFGVFAYQVPVRYFLRPVVPGLTEENSWIGWWKPGLASALLGVGFLFGWLAYKLSTWKGPRIDSSYIGGEKPLPAENRVTGTEFYNTVAEMPPWRIIYRLAERKAFDLYNQAAAGVFFIAGGLRSVHNGVLPFYLSWVLAGSLILLLILRG